MENLFKVNSHILVHAKDGGNGYHGSCKFCGLALVTDLGYSSWDNTTCVERDKFFWENELPEEIQNYAKFRGLHWDKKEQLFKKAYSNDTYTVKQINDIIQEIKNT